MKKILPIIIALAVGIGGGYVLFTSINSETISTSEKSESHTHSLSATAFVDGALTKEIAEVDCTLSNGTETECNEISIAGTPANAAIGPFCPTTITATADEVGIWVDGDNLYDIDGSFITSLAEIYDDPNWKLYNDDGSVRVTDTQAAFEAAARPDVDPDYNNYCVEGRIEWLTNGEPVEATYLIPHAPVNTGEPSIIVGKIGVTLNGVVIDTSAPISAILGAYTIAAFDDCGGHVNPIEGYHIHAATDCSEVGEAEEGETKVFAIAMDGFSIHSPYEAGEEPTDLDACNGHTTDALGYHYHANPAEDNAVLSCFMGLVEASQDIGAGGPPGGGPPANLPPEEQ